MNLKKEAAIALTLAGLFLVTLIVTVNDSKSPFNLSNTQTAAVSGTGSGLIAHYMFDDTANDSAGSNHGTISGGATYAEGKIGKAISFDGSDDRVNLGSDFVGTSAATVSAWIYARSFGELNAGEIIGNNKIRLRVNSFLSRFSFTSNNFTNGAVAANNSVALNQWIHITATRDADGVANMYVNGVLSGTANQNSGTPAPGTSL